MSNVVDISSKKDQYATEADINKMLAAINKLITALKK